MSITYHVSSSQRHGGLRLIRTSLSTRNLSQEKASPTTLGCLQLNRNFHCTVPRQQSPGPTTTATDYKTKLQNEKLKKIHDRIIRVDHAGEYGANRIYAGQMAVLGKTKSGPLIQHMWDQEKEHLRIFEKLIPKYRARPTVLLPFWNVAGFVLGAGSALLGEKGAMACTVAVESSITEHYNNQIRELMTSSENLQDNKELLDYIQKCRDEEQEHHDTGLANDAEQAPAYSLLTKVIKTGCKTAIWISERV